MLFTYGLYSIELVPFDQINMHTYVSILSTTCNPFVCCTGALALQHSTAAYTLISYSYQVTALHN